MHAGGHRRQRPLDVLGVGQGNVDGIDAGIIEQRLVAGDGARNRPVAREGFAAPAIAAGDGDEIAATSQAHGGNHPPVDARRAKEAPP